MVSRPGNKRQWLWADKANFPPAQSFLVKTILILRGAPLRSPWRHLTFPVTIQEVVRSLLFVFVGRQSSLFFWLNVSLSRAEMATFISVPLKKSSEVDLVKPLSKFVTVTYPAGEEQGEYIRAVEELNKLRRNALGRPLDKHESSLEILLR